MSRLRGTIALLPLLAATTCSLNPQIDPPSDTTNKSGRDGGVPVGSPMAGNGGFVQFPGSGGAAAGTGGYPSYAGALGVGGTSSGQDAGALPDAAAPDGSRLDSGPGDSGHGGAGGTPGIDAGPHKDAGKD